MSNADWVNDKFRFVIEEARTNRIVTYDLPVQNPKIMKKLSGSSVIEFDVDYRDPRVVDPDTGKPIMFKPWGHWCHIEYNYRGKRKIWASGIMKPSEVDPQTGLLHAQFEGFSAYPKGLPWLQNWNPIAVDPFTIVNKMWTHIQSYSNGNLGVTVYSLDIDGVSKVTPPASGTLMLPGFSFDGQTFVLDFFAVFLRAIDFTDCGDYVTKLARDIPFDYFEEAEWNSNRTGVNKYLQLAYPNGGVLQSDLSFRLNENVFQAKSRIESEIEWTSDIIIRGWFPGKVYSSTLQNADPKRYRRTILEEDAQINSNERAEAWSHRQLTRRQFPNYWESIIVNMYHSNAPFGSYDVGDIIRVQGVMPWVGEVDMAHRIIAMSVDPTTNTCELSLRAEGAFNYDPIYFQGVDPNLLTNPSFTTNLSGWDQVAGSWSRDALFGSTNLGAVRVTANATDKELRTSSAITVAARDRVSFSGVVYFENAESVVASSPIRLTATGYNSSGVAIVQPIFDGIVQPSGGSDRWVGFGGSWTVPSGVTSMKVSLRVLDAMSTGDVWFDDLYLSKYHLP